MGPDRRKAVHAEVGIVVADPFDRQLDQAGRLAVLEDLVRVVVGHQRGIVEQPHLAADRQRMRAEVPRWRADADRADTGDLLERVGRTHLQLALGVARQLAVALVDPAVNADLVALGDVRALFVGIQQRDHGGHEEARLDVRPIEQRADARQGGAGAVLAPAELARRGPPSAQRARLVVRIERQRDRAARAVLPARRLQRAAGAHLADDAAPLRLGPLPGQILARGRHAVCRHRPAPFVARHAHPDATDEIAPLAEVPSRPNVELGWRVSAMQCRGRITL